MGVARKNNPGSKAGPRFPYNRLEAMLLGIDHELRQATGANSRLSHKEVMPAAVARATGAHSSQVHRWKTEGLTFYAADKAACAIGKHPANIWPEWESKGIEFYGS